MRTITISCPSCRTEFKHVTIDQAERILFHACADCREAKRPAAQFQSGRRREIPELGVDERAHTG